MCLARGYASDVYLCIVSNGSNGTEIARSLLASVELDPKGFGLITSALTVIIKSFGRSDFENFALITFLQFTNSRPLLTALIYCSVENDMLKDGVQIVGTGAADLGVE